MERELATVLPIEFTREPLRTKYDWKELETLPEPGKEGNERPLPIPIPPIDRPEPSSVPPTDRPATPRWQKRLKGLVQTPSFWLLLVIVYLLWTR